MFWLTYPPSPRLIGCARRVRVWHVIFNSGFVSCTQVHLSVHFQPTSGMSIVIQLNFHHKMIRFLIQASNRLEMHPKGKHSLALQNKTSECVISIDRRRNQLKLTKCFQLIRVIPSLSSPSTHSHFKVSL